MQLHRVATDGPMKLRSSRALEAALGLVSAAGDRRFGDLGLEQLNQLGRVGWWTVYRLREGLEPDWQLGGSAVADGIMARAWACYHGGLWQCDRGFAAVAEALAGQGSALMHLHANELAGPHREQIYSALDLTERASLVRRQADGSLLCVNLYRGQGMPAFADDELDNLACVGDLMLRAVESHLRFPVPPRSPLEALPRREREVCERLLRGLTFDGIAADLGVSANTVKTYRDRAFDRLGIHHRSQLFAIALDALSALSPARVTDSRSLDA
jgi:DNA-binding CsgD family transcriptional regulator